jgi:hydrogenase nickel incorporation protein HypB
MVLTKMDLLPYVNFDVEQCVQYARRINPSLDVICVSINTADRLKPWYDWLEQQRMEE